MYRNFRDILNILLIVFDPNLWSPQKISMSRNVFLSRKIRKNWEMSRPRCSIIHTRFIHWKGSAEWLIVKNFKWYFHEKPSKMPLTLRQQSASAIFCGRHGTKMSHVGAVVEDEVASPARTAYSNGSCACSAERIKGEGEADATWRKELNRAQVKRPSSKGVQLCSAFFLRTVFEFAWKTNSSQKCTCTAYMNDRVLLYSNIVTLQAQLWRHLTYFFSSLKIFSYPSFFYRKICLRQTV